jgi:hypothetical protein
MGKALNRPALYTRPSFETATRVAGYWFEQLVFPIAKEQNIEIIDLYYSDAVKQNFRKALIERDPIFVGGVGHGSEKNYTGWYYDILLNRDDQMDWMLMEERSGSFLSCKFGLAGETFVEHGMRGFRGYTDYFVFMVSGGNDGAAEPFMRCHMIYDFNILRGMKQGEAHEIALREWDKEIAGADITSARFLIQDRDADKFFGDPDYAPFYRPPEPQVFKCYWCSNEYTNLDELLKHVCEAHCAKPRPCILPKWIRQFVGCPLSQT